MSASIDTVSEVVKRTNSEIVLFFIIIAVVVMAITIPLYRSVAASAAKKRQQYFERERQLMKVIEENAKANTKLSVVLDRLNRNCLECKAEQVDLFERVHLKQEETLIRVNEVYTILTERKGSNESKT